MSKVFFASDHGGYELKNKLVQYVKGLGHDVVDKGASTFDAQDDYPEIIAGAAREVSKDSESFGIILGGSGQGEAIVANRFPNVRAAVFYNLAVAKSAVDITGRESTDPYEIVRLARLHNNANIISLSSRFLSVEEAKEAVSIFLGTKFSEDERHVRRIKQIDNVNYH